MNGTHKNPKDTVAAFLLPQNRILFFKEKKALTLLKQNVTIILTVVPNVVSLPKQLLN